MNVSNFNPFDTLILLSTKSLIEWETENFLQTPITDSPSPQFSKRIENIIQKDIKKKKHHSFYQTIKVAAIACLIVLSILFTACVSIADVREAIWKAIVEWREDHIYIEFESTEQSLQDIQTETNVPESESIVESIKTIELPTTIEVINVPSYVPHGYTIIADAQKSSYYQEYYTDKGEFLYLFEQTLQGEHFWIDNTGAEAKEVNINGWNGVLVITDDKTFLMWQDQYYAYIIEGYFENENEIIKIAKSVRKLP